MPEAGTSAATAPEALIVDIEGYEGPLDLLLALARSQKIDLRRLSVLALADQYLDFVASARQLRLELAADYLVMAAWLAYLKSRLLLPPEATDEDDGPSAEALAARLAFQLERLEAMREAAARLMARHRLGRDVFARGAPETLARQRRIVLTASLLDLLQAYARLRTRDEFRPAVFDRRDVYTMEAALERLHGLIGTATGWAELADWLPADWRSDPRRRRSATAATLAAALELARLGRVQLDQTATFGPLRMRPRRAE